MLDANETPCQAHWSYGPPPAAAASSDVRAVAFTDHGIWYKDQTLNLLGRGALDHLDAAIDAGAEAAFAFLANLVRARSVAGIEQDALNIFAAEAESLGLSTTRLPFPGGPVADPSAGIAPTTTDRFQVLAASPGRRGRCTCC